MMTSLVDSKKLHKEELSTLKELFQDSWSEDDLLAVIEEFNGDLDLIVSRITEGYVKPFSEAKKQHQQQTSSSNTTTSSFTNPGSKWKNQNSDRRKRNSGHGENKKRFAKGFVDKSGENADSNSAPAAHVKGNKENVNSKPVSSAAHGNRNASFKKNPSSTHHETKPHYPQQQQSSQNSRNSSIVSGDSWSKIARKSEAIPINNNSNTLEAVVLRSKNAPNSPCLSTEVNVSVSPQPTLSDHLSSFAPADKEDQMTNFSFGDESVTTNDATATLASELSNEKSATALYSSEVEKKSFYYNNGNTNNVASSTKGFSDMQSSKSASSSRSNNGKAANFNPVMFSNSLSSKEGPHAVGNLSLRFGSLGIDESAVATAAPTSSSTAAPSAPAAVVKPKASTAGNNNNSTSSRLAVASGKPLPPAPSNHLRSPPRKSSTASQTQSFLNASSVDHLSYLPPFAHDYALYGGGGGSGAVAGASNNGNAFNEVLHHPFHPHAAAYGSASDVGAGSYNNNNSNSSTFEDVNNGSNKGGLAGIPSNVNSTSTETDMNAFNAMSQFAAAYYPAYYVHGHHPFPGAFPTSNGGYYAGNPAAPTASTAVPPVNSSQNNGGGGSKGNLSKNPSDATISTSTKGFQSERGLASSSEAYEDSMSMAASYAPYNGGNPNLQHQSFIPSSTGMNSAKTAAISSSNRNGSRNAAAISNPSNHPGSANNNMEPFGYHNFASSTSVATGVGLNYQQQHQHHHHHHHQPQQIDFSNSQQQQQQAFHQPPFQHMQFTAPPYHHLMNFPPRSWNPPTANNAVGQNSSSGNNSSKGVDNVKKQ